MLAGYLNSWVKKSKQHLNAISRCILFHQLWCNLKLDIKLIYTCTNILLGG